MAKSSYSYIDIDNILYSAIRNKDHLSTKKKNHFKNFIISLRTWLKEKDEAKNKNTVHSVLNFLPKSYVNLNNQTGGEEDGQTFSNIKEGHKASFSYIEALLSIAFIFNFKPFQEFLFKKIEKKVSILIELTNLRVLICGHPTLAAAFISVYLKRNIANSKIITVQHGIYNLKKYKVLWFEKEIASHVVVYGANFKNLYKGQGVPEKKVIVGNPYFSGKITNKKKEGFKSLELTNKKVLFLGQQFYKVSKDISGPYNIAVSDLINYFKGLDINIYYKPHPREDVNKSLSKQNIADLKFFNKASTSEEYLNSFDVYYSVNSTLLLETYLQKKICFQVDIPTFNVDKFSNYTGIPLIDENNTKEHLPIKGYKWYVDDKYLNLSATPKASLLQIIEQVIEE